MENLKLIDNKGTKFIGTLDEIKCEQNTRSTTLRKISRILKRNYAIYVSICSLDELRELICNINTIQFEEKELEHLIKRIMMNWEGLQHVQKAQDLNIKCRKSFYSYDEGHTFP